MWHFYFIVTVVRHGLGVSYILAFGNREQLVIQEGAGPKSNSGGCVLHSQKRVDLALASVEIIVINGEDEGR